MSAGADAIHPGYGFLSENAGFAQAVADAGLTFIGPDAETIKLMGDKISARNFAEAHGVPVAPSVMPTDDLDAFAAAAAKIGFPLLIKAAAGGGGKGMSIVRSAAELGEAARIAASEAKRYFGDGRVYAELYVERPRHIEVQVLGDGKGNADPSVRARMLGAAPLPEDRRGGAGRQPAGSRCASGFARRPCSLPPPRTTRMPARSSSSSAPTAASSSSK